MDSNQPEPAVGAENEQRRRRMRRVAGAMSVFAAFMGLFSFTSVAGNPRFEAIHTLDVIRLLTAGASFGVALVVMIQLFAFPDSPSANK